MLLVLGLIDVITRSHLYLYLYLYLHLYLHVK